MRIGIIIHSYTGNTLSVGERLKESLIAKGHIVQLERVIAENEDPNAKEKVRLKSIPDISNYDYIIIGAPVRGFSLSPAIRVYLSQITEIQRKKVVCFVTQHFPKPWMGGNRAIKQMLGIIEQKGVNVLATGVINWTNKTREEQIDGLIDRLCRI